MASTLERMRRLQGLRPQQSRPELTYTPLDEAGDPLCARAQPSGGGELPTGSEVETAAGRCYVVTTAVPLGGGSAARPLAAALAASPAVLAPFHPEFLLEQEAGFADAAFVDTETTGLGSGGGVYAFMVGVGTFERAGSGVAGEWDASGLEQVAPSHFVVRQFFMRHPGEEPALLAAVAATVGARRLAVTFNGRSFDLPLLRARYRQNRPFLPEPYHTAALLEEGHPHLDLLLPARRLWRRRLQSCRLGNLEQQILGIQRVEEDVPGALIPALYQEYLRTRQAGELRRVFYHNCEDILSMVSLGEQLVVAYANSFEPNDDLLHAEELLSLAISYGQRSESRLAERAYRLAAARASSEALCAAIFEGWAQLLKQQARWAEAAEIWQRWLTSVGGADATPFIELAKYHEWQTHDLEQAEMWAGWGAHTVEAIAPHRRLPGQLADLQHRLQRIQRKRAGST